MTGGQRPARPNDNAGRPVADLGGPVSEFLRPDGLAGICVIGASEIPRLRRASEIDRHVERATSRVGKSFPVVPHNMKPLIRHRAGPGSLRLA